MPVAQMPKRAIAISDAVERFLITYDARLIQEGCSESYLGQVARDLFYVVVGRQEHIDGSGDIVGSDRFQSLSGEFRVDCIVF